MPYTFDLHRILIGDSSPLFLLEILFRCSVLFIFLIAVLRILANRGIGQLTTFEFALIVALGSAAGDPLLYPEVPLIHGMLVILIIVGLQQIVVRASLFSDRFERVAAGAPTRIVKNGELDVAGCHQAQLSHLEVFMELRQGGVRQLGEVERAYFEIDGRVSIFPYPLVEVRPGLLILPHGDHIFERQESPDAVCGYCGHLSSDQESSCPNCGKKDWTIPVQPRKI